MIILKKNSSIFFIILLLVFPKMFSQNLASQFGVSVVSYGATPSTNYKNARDSSDAIQRAIDENPGKLILIPSGIYLLSKPLIISNNIRITGENKYSTILQPLNNDGIIINAGFVDLENFFLYGGNGTGITVNGNNNTNITNILLQNVKNGIVLANSSNTKINQVDIIINEEQTPKVQKGIILVGKSVNNFISDSRIVAEDIGVEIQRNSDRSEGLMLSNVLIFKANYGVKSEGILSFHINNCIIDLCKQYGIFAEQTTGLLVSNSWIYSIGNNDSETIRLYSSWDCHFLANNILNAQGSIISVGDYSHNNTFSNNTMENLKSYKRSVVLDNTSSLNIFKNNIFKFRDNSALFFINDGRGNIISDNQLIKTN